MKKILSVFLALCIIFASCCCAVSAISEKSEISEYPIIIVPGYSSSNLFKINSDGTEDKLWGLGVDEILSAVLSKIAQLGIGIGALTVGNSDYLADVVGKEVVKMLGDLKCNDDGTSYNNVRVMFPTAHESNRQVIADEFGNYVDYQFEPDITRFLTEYTGDNSKIYNFNVDFRMGAVECATRLDEYIQEVKEDSGYDKVNIFSISHGGQVTGTYLTLFGYKKDVNNALLTVPALKGSCLLYDLLPQDIHFDELNLVYFLENGLMLEDDFHWLVEAQQLGFLDDVLNKLIPYVMQVGGNWGSVWDFTPTDIYEQMKEKWLDPVKNKELIEKSDYMHYEIMPQFETSLQKCNDEYGMHVNIIAGTDIDSTSGYKVNSDGIIFTSSATGATCPEHGLRFSDGYTQVNDCGGKYKVSPAMTVDASTAYMPDNTWFVSGMFHGMMVWDLYVRELMMNLVLTNEIKDVYSDKKFPQFHESSNPSNGVWACFDNSTEGYVSAEDSEIIIKNTSLKDKTVRLIGIESDGMDLKFDINSSNRKIKAGESVSIPFTGTIPAVANSRASLIFTFVIEGSLTPITQRVMSFTIINGDKPQYSESSPFSSAYAKTPLDSSFLSNITGFLSKLGLYNLVSVIYNIILSVTKLFA